MSFCRNIDKSQLMNLLTGMAGIYTCYFIGGLLHESLYDFLDVVDSKNPISIESQINIKYAAIPSV